jgi:hemoglobin
VNTVPDLDSREQVERFVDLFYSRLLDDEVMAPIFLDVAAVDLSQHLPHIKDYWSKLLLGERDYQRHTMNIHRQLHGKQALAPADFERWLGHFCTTLDASFAGPQTEKARRIASAIAANMEKGLTH